ncbi:relaxase/mobilization nuclease domain-containing protein [Riemerella columbipharyngis]|uniref:Relaxase/Mobilisation nuclease domain-containing protein n=1 Tax=Riemerella columbipharyngis TaxID=1071918 RepID=A0A1G6ZB94_9FLAO|nr:relaxase/mobilization nuclease domain-containing protein [Riemerella columbipharyngis]SDD99573.1 Relaxase/Mobilisation nuclease domain-containing protein [Riemerella columbipharyngis]
MIVKILSSSSREFNGVRYNDKKMKKGDGELMLMKNFPENINKNSSQEDVRNYLKAISAINPKVKKPQFHAVISAKFRENSKEELSKIAETFMSEMGYDKQPYIVVFHNDTENNHVHIVSTRVDKKTGRKINDSFERLKAQRAMEVCLKKVFGIEESEQKLNELLRYKYSSFNQLKSLLERNGYEIHEKEDNSYSISKNGNLVKILNPSDINFRKPDAKRKMQIKAILLKYQNQYSNKVFRVIDRRADVGTENKNPKIEYQSELSKRMKDMFGIDIVFHHKDGKESFGYTLIDNKTKQIYKGSDLIKLNELFEFNQEEIDKKIFEQLNDFNIRNEEEKKILITLFEQKGVKVQPYHIISHKLRLKKEMVNEIRNDAIKFLSNKKNDDISIIKGENGKLYLTHMKFHHIQELKSLIGEELYHKYITKQEESSIQLAKEAAKDLTTSIFSIGGPTYVSKDPYEIEKENKKKKKKRK